MNLYHVSPDIIRFNIFNLLGDDVGLDGHFGFYYNIKSDEYLIFKKGSFGSLTWYPEEENKTLLIPTQKQKVFLEKYIQERLETACYYNRSTINHKGFFLSPALRKREANGEYLSCQKQYFIWESDDHATPEQKELDKQAIRMLDKL